MFLTIIFFSFLVLTQSKKFLEALGSEIGTGLVLAFHFQFRTMWAATAQKKQYHKFNIFWFFKCQSAPNNSNESYTFLSVWAVTVHIFLKATKFCKISTLLLSYVVPVKSKVEISQNFVAFLEQVYELYDHFIRQKANFQLFRIYRFGIRRLEIGCSILWRSYLKLT